MPNEVAMVQGSIWRDPQFRALSRPAQATYVQLLSQKELDRAGVIPFLPTKWVKGCHAMGLADLMADLDELQAAGFVYRDEDTDETLIRSYVRHNNIVRQPNILKNTLKCARAVASTSLRRVLAAELRRLGKAEATATADEIDPGEPAPPEGCKNPSETLPEPIENPSRGVEPFPNPSRTPGVGVEVVGNEQLRSYSSSQTMIRERENENRSSPEAFSDGTPMPADPGPEAWATDGGNALATVHALRPEPPTHVETGTRPKAPRPTQAARTVVGQVIPGLTRQVIDQLAIHVAQAAHDDVPDAATRAGLAAWRDDRTKPSPGLLPFLIGNAARDLAAQAPTADQRPARPSKLRLMAELAAAERARENAQLTAPNRGEIE